MLASHETYSTYRSRPTTWVVASGTPSPKCVRINRWSSRALTPCAAPVPTAPRNFPTAMRGVASSRRTSWRRNSSSQTAALSPNVIGTAACPWVRPNITVSRSRSATSAQTPINKQSCSRNITMLSRSCNATAVSTMSLDVAPRWMHHPASPAASAMAFVNAMMSCRVSASISETRSLRTDSGLEIAATAL